MMRTALITPIAVAIAALSLLGCGSDDTALRSAPSTLPELDDVVVTVAPSELSGDPIVIGDFVPDDAEVIPVSDLVDADAGVEDEDDDEPTDASERDDDGLNPLGGDDPEDRRMPDVVCMNLQDAQDEIQDRGVFFSRSEDATGDGRRQLWDRNWTVVAQTPAAGEPIGEGDAVLSVVKNDEPNGC